MYFIILCWWVGWMWVGMGGGWDEEGGGGGEAVGGDI